MAEGEDPKPTGSVTCEFCECRISRASGEMVARSKKATAMMRLDDDVATLREQVAERDKALADVRKELEDAKAKIPAPAGVGAGDDDDW